MRISHAQLHERLELAEQDKRSAVALAQAQVANELQKAAAAKDAEIQALKAQLDAGGVERDLAVSAGPERGGEAARCAGE